MRTCTSGLDGLADLTGALQLACRCELAYGDDVRCGNGGGIRGRRPQRAAQGGAGLGIERRVVQGSETRLQRGQVIRQSAEVGVLFRQRGVLRL